MRDFAKLTPIVFFSQPRLSMCYQSTLRSHLSFKYKMSSCADHNLEMSNLNSNEDNLSLPCVENGRFAKLKCKKSTGICFRISISILFLLFIVALIPIIIFLAPKKEQVPAVSSQLAQKNETAQLKCEPRDEFDLKKGTFFDEYHWETSIWRKYVHSVKQLETEDKCQKLCLKSTTLEVSKYRFMLK